MLVVLFVSNATAWIITMGSRVSSRNFALLLSSTIRMAIKIRNVSSYIYYCISISRTPPFRGVLFNKKGDAIRLCLDECSRITRGLGYSTC